MTKYEMTIGIECHVQLATNTKLFSPADNDARDKEPNSVVHPIDFGLPGMLPVLNKEAVNLAVKAGKALNAKIANESRFDRKHYFYPDLPTGYQITQMYQPTILAGYVDVPMEDGGVVRVGIDHAHIEMDAGKLSHYGTYSLVDLNRAGTPLIEIVSNPDIHSPAEARSYAEELHRLMVYAGVTHGDLYHGNMRFDVNISVAPAGASELGKRAEIKNLNSFRSVERAAEYEFKRQKALLEKGETVTQETRGWNDDTGVTTSQRSKEDAQDYRYMPDPDIPPVRLTDEYITEIQDDVPKLPPYYRKKWQTIGVDNSVINTLLGDQKHARLIDAVQDEAGDDAAKRVAHWLTSSATATENILPESAEIKSGPFVELSKMVDANELSSTSAKEVFNELLHGAGSARGVAESKNLLQVSDEGTIAAIVDEVLADPSSAKVIDDIRAGNDKAIGFLVGQIMKRSHGKANPALAQKLIRERL